MYMTEDCDTSSEKYCLADKEIEKVRQVDFLRQEAGYDGTLQFLVLQRVRQVLLLEWEPATVPGGIDRTRMSVHNGEMGSCRESVHNLSSSSTWSYNALYVFASLGYNQ